MKEEYPDRRYRKTLGFLKEHTDPGETILDIGTPNRFSSLMQKEGYRVYSTGGEDLDTNYNVIRNYDVDCYTSFQIFEHLLAPFNILNAIPRGKLISSVPLKVWFSQAYWSRDNEWDRHYHEFEPRQYDWLLQKSGWKIISSELWRSPDKIRPGIRPLLRLIWPSYYFVCAIKDDHATERRK